MVFNICDNFSSVYCYQCVYGNEGCMEPSRPTEGETDLSAQFDELNSKLRSLARLRSTEIEKYLEEQKKVDNGIIKILILGGPSSGKSTIFKQMQIIHSGGFKRSDELEYFERLINSNIRDIYFQFLRGAKHLNQSLDSIQECSDEINEIYRKMGQTIEFSRPKLGELLETFWESPPVQRVFARRYEIELLDSAKYYLENVRRIMSTGYIPNIEDIVHSRRPTYTINSILFEYSGLRLNMIDVGGQKSERRKWLHLFDDARVILFVVDLTGFAKKSDESRGDIKRFSIFKDWRENAQNIPDMKVALKIFEEVATNRILINAIFLMFLNKLDLFEELLPHVSLSTCFSKYRGGNDFDETTQFIRHRFLKAAHPRKSVFPHFTTATNTENIKLVFRACMESVFKANSKATGLS